MDAGMSIAYNGLFNGPHFGGAGQIFESRALSQASCVGPHSALGWRAACRTRKIPAVSNWWVEPLRLPCPRSLHTSCRFRALIMLPPVHHTRSSLPWGTAMPVHRNSRGLSSLLIDIATSPYSKALNLSTLPLRLILLLRQSSHCLIH